MAVDLEAWFQTRGRGSKMRMVEMASSQKGSGKGNDMAQTSGHLRSTLREESP